MRNLKVYYTYKTKNATVQDLCIVQSKTKRFTKTQQLNTQLKLATQLNLKHFYAVTLTQHSAPGVEICGSTCVFPPTKFCIRMQT